MRVTQRVLFAGTLMSQLWFCTIAGASSTRGQQNKTPAPIVSENLAPGSMVIERAKQGDAKAQYQLGLSYLKNGIPQDDEQATEWLRKSAAQDFPDAEFLLGFVYEHGKGVRRNYREARVNYEAAARHGHAIAENNLAGMYQRGEGVRKDLSQAMEWYRRAAEGGDVVAECNLASVYFRGKGVPRDYAQAATWFRTAAERGFAPAQENVAWMYYRGAGVPLDFSEAARWVRSAGEQGYARAQLDLGYLYEQGKGVPLNYVSAYTWYKAALDGGERRADGALKSLGPRMTKKQIEDATAAAALIKRSIPGTAAFASSESVGGSFLPPR